MADNMISPGVYTQIFSLSSYLSATPGTIGFVPVITEKGKDNVLYRCTGLDDYLQNFGEPDIRTFGKYYGCGPYIATQHLSVSNDLYVVRCLPDDAIYAHTYIYFADVKDFPTDKRFVELYKGYIYDDTTKVEMTLFEVDDNIFTGSTAAEKNYKLLQLKENARFFDEEKEDTDKADDVRWTNVLKYAKITDGTPYYLLDSEKTEVVTPAQTAMWTYAKQALEDSNCTCLDSEEQIATSEASVAFVTDSRYAEDPEHTVEGKNYYVVKTGESEVTVTPAVTKTYSQLAIESGTALDSNLEVIVPSNDDENAAVPVYTTSENYAQKINDAAVPSGYVPDENAVVEKSIRWKVLESTTSSADGNVGSYKLQNNFYTGSHIGLSAFSVEPGLTYPITSDVTCFEQKVAKNVPLYIVKGVQKNVNEDVITYTAKDSGPDSRQDAFDRRVGFNKDGYLELDSAEKVVFTSHLELADPEDAIENGELKTPEKYAEVAPVWEIDPEPWYVLDSQKALDAIDSHNAYDKNGFLTTSDKDAVYCADFQYAVIEDNEFKTETAVALKSPVGQIPAKQKFKRAVGKYIYVLDRTIGKDKINMLCAKCQAYDENGYPTMDWKKAVLTSCVGILKYDAEKSRDVVDEYFAKTDVTPKMSNTQKLDGLFYGNDTLIDGVINISGGRTITNKVFPHEALLGYVRAVGRGDYYNDYSIKIVSDANPANFGTYKFQVFELQDGVEALAESFNVSFDPTALDGDGESLYFADVINKFSTRVVVEANENAVTLFKDQVEAFYENDPSLDGIADDYTVDVKENGRIVGQKLLLNKAFPAVPFYNSKTDTIEAKVQRYDTDGNKVFDENDEPVKDFVPGSEYGYKAQIIFEAYYAKAWAEKAKANAADKYNAALDAVNNGVEGSEVQLGLAIDEMNLAQDMTATAADIYAWATAQNLMNLNDSDSLATGEQPYYLANGSMGSLIDDKGKVNAAIGNQILSYGYTGLLKNPVVTKSVDESTGMVKYNQQYTDNVYDLDWIYFSIVYDPGYKPDVKQAALDLVDTYRRDCVLISDCTDNADYEQCLKYVGAIKGAADAHMWNTYLAARYEPYSRIYDKFTGKDIWVSPVYHMAKMIPQNDALYDLWYASAGFNRGTVSEIKELRYSPNKSMRDQLYLAQVNPIVHFPEGMTVWGMLTTQKKNDALSDLPAVRTVLYIKRALEQYCRNYVFEFNEPATWTAISGECNSFLGQIQSAGGIEGYAVEVDATDYELKTKTCHVNVTLTMKKILEKIKLNFYVQ